MALVTLATVIGAIAAYFAGLTAVANIAAVYQEYRKTNPRRRGTVNVQGDFVEGYLMQHRGRTIKSPQVPGQASYYMECLDWLPQICRGPKLGRRASAKLTSVKRFKSFITGESADPEPELWGEPYLTDSVQQAPDTYHDDLAYIGISTGRKPMFRLENAQQHWATVKDGSACDQSSTDEETIVVVNWKSQILTMFTKQRRGKYFRNYQVRDANLEYFAQEYQQHVAFTGVIRGGRLVGTSSDIFLAEDDPTCDLKSRNGWALLGLRADAQLGESLFLGMPRAALFGLIECLYKDPTLLNVDMLYGGGASGMEYVHVDTLDQIRLEYEEDNIFSVFALNKEETLRYAQQSVLVG